MAGANVPCQGPGLGDPRPHDTHPPPTKVTVSIFLRSWVPGPLQTPDPPAISPGTGTTCRATPQTLAPPGPLGGLTPGTALRLSSKRGGRPGPAIAPETGCRNPGRSCGSVQGHVPPQGDLPTPAGVPAGQLLPVPASVGFLRLFSAESADRQGAGPGRPLLGWRGGAHAPEAWPYRRVTAKGQRNQRPGSTPYSTHLAGRHTQYQGTATGPTSALT